MENTTDEILNRLNKIEIEIQFIKENLEDDGELSVWAKKTLEEARKTPEKEYISHEEVKKRIFAKKWLNRSSAQIKIQENFHNELFNKMESASI